MSAKAQRIAAQMMDAAKLSLAALTPVLAYDTDKMPYVMVGAGAAAGANAILKVKPVAWPDGINAFGMPQEVYTPHVVQVVTEADPFAGAGANPLTNQQFLSVIGIALATGCVVEWYESAVGDSPDLDDLVPAKLKASWNPNAYFGTHKAGQ